MSHGLETCIEHALDNYLLDMVHGPPVSWLDEQTIKDLQQAVAHRYASDQDHPLANSLSKSLRQIEAVRASNYAPPPQSPRDYPLFVTAEDGSLLAAHPDHSMGKVLIDMFILSYVPQ